jgi:ABC-2 type transport system ATP-binding protein
MRDLLRGYADSGGTVLLSSHLLHEIEVVADDIVVIGHGKIVARGTKADLLASAGTVVRAPELPELQRALAARGLVATPSGDGALHTEADPTRVGQVALEAGVAVSELRPADGGGLEQLFLTLTAREEVAA